MLDRRALILVALLAMAFAIFMMVKKQIAPEEGDKTGAIGGAIHVAAEKGVKTQRLKT